MPEPHIRVSARGLIRRGDELLVARELRPDGETSYHYPLGGGVEFGEHSEEALHREFREELGVSLSNVSHFETYEAVFSFDGQRHHEIWRVYEADIDEAWPYERDEFPGYEPEYDERIACVWKPPADFRDEKDPETLYPEALVADL